MLGEGRYGRGSGYLGGGGIIGLRFENPSSFLYISQSQLDDPCQWP